MEREKRIDQSVDAFFEVKPPDISDQKFIGLSEDFFEMRDARLGLGADKAAWIDSAMNQAHPGGARFIVALHFGLDGFTVHKNGIRASGSPAFDIKRHSIAGIVDFA